MIFDTHTHYDDHQYDEDLDSLLNSFKENNISGAIAASANFDDIPRIIEICRKYPFIYPTIGIHPEYADSFDDRVKSGLRTYIKEVNPVAIGEIGLDYHYEGFDAQAQEDCFLHQLKLAREFDKPVIIHSRDASQETFDLIMAEKPEKRGVIHCFSSSYEMAKRYVDDGFYIGIGGVVTFKNGKKLKEVAEKIPLEFLLLETDCPYLAPTPFRGERNSSLYLPYVVKEIASLRGISEEEVIAATEENAKRLFNL
jgi:TatD DNase family protein